MSSDGQVPGASGTAVSDTVLNPTRGRAFAARGKGRGLSLEKNARGRGSSNGGPSRGRGGGFQIARGGSARSTTKLNSPAEPSKPGHESECERGGNPVTPVQQQVELEPPVSLTSITVRP